MREHGIELDSSMVGTRLFE